MPKYKIAVIEVLLKNNKTAKYGELVEDTQFNTDTDKLMEDGFITKPTKGEIEAAKKLSDTDSKEKDSEAKEAAKKRAEIEKAAEAKTQAAQAATAVATLGEK